MNIPCLSPLLKHQHENCIYPFLWMKGEPEEVLREEMARIHECGIGGVCVESRPHPDFVGPGWWKDFGIIVEEAKRYGMKIWILDDAHFPTGAANGLLAQKYPERARQYVMVQHTDAVGPVPCAELDVALMMTKRFTWMDFGKPRNVPLVDKTELLSVTARRVIRDDILSEEVIDLTHLVTDGKLYWDLPAGVWRICISFTTYDFGSRNDYINYIDPDSVNTLIEAIYEPHYEHYKEEFGKTIVGFFSDEPGFYNTEGFTMTESIGRKMMALPWSGEMPALMEEHLGKDWALRLPTLWFAGEGEEHTAYARFAYMDSVTRLYAKNFCGQLGQWCREHGVEYVGHVIEDNNQHSRLGCGAGHYFRAMEGQDIAGIDNIGAQIIPGSDMANRHTPAYIGDGEFFHYAMGKLGASSAQIDPKKRGRALCETYGAYGWNLGVKGMKWITDYLLLQGINYLVPHAFSMKDYPDNDCPPHFYARGKNPQFPWFAHLMKYANRMCGLLNGGQNVPQAAILYHGEQEWMNDCMMMQEPARVLAQHQIDFEFLPVDVFRDVDYYGTGVEDGVLTVNGREMKVLIVPATDCIGADLLRFLTDHPHLPVLFLDRLPRTVVGARDEAEAARLALCLKAYPAIPLSQLADHLKVWNVKDAVAEADVPQLGIYHYRKQDSHIYFLFNTSLGDTVDTAVTFPMDHPAAAYDGMDNRVSPVAQERTDSGVRVPVKLRPYQSLVLVFDPAVAEVAPDTAPAEEQVLDLSRGWTLTLTGSDGSKEAPGAWDLSLPVSRKYPLFSGLMEYEATVEVPQWEGSIAFRPQYVFESAELFVNGVSAGKQLTPDYCWDIAHLCRPGGNTLKLVVANTLTRDSLRRESPFGPEREITEPSGMFGKVELVLTR